MMKFKRLKSGDEKVIEQVTRKFKSGDSTIEKCNEFLQNENNVLCVAMDDDEVVGFILLYWLTRFDGQEQMIFLYEIEVLDEYRRKGVGTYMFKKCMESINIADMSKMFVITYRSNEPAMKFYESLGGKWDELESLVYVWRL